jgi:transposase
MLPKSKRRVHGAEFKTQVVAECEQPGASVAAIALAHDLNVNLLRKWLVGRGIQRTGLVAQRAVPRAAAGADETSVRSPQFSPVEVAAAPVAAMATATASERAEPPVAEIHVELTRGATQLSVRWPSAQATACAAWLRELATVALKD